MFYQNVSVENRIYMMSTLKQLDFTLVSTQIQEFIASLSQQYGYQLQRVCEHLA